MSRFIKETFKYIIILGLSAGILLAGFYLPERFLARERNAAIHVYGQIEADSVNPYGDEYKNKKAHLGKVMKTLNNLDIYELDKLEDEVNIAPGANPHLANEIRVLNSNFALASSIYSNADVRELEKGYERFTSFVFNWKKELLDFIGEADEIRLLKPKSGEKLGVVIATRVGVQPFEHEVMYKIPTVIKIYFDLETGIPIYIRMDNAYMLKDEVIASFESCIAEIKKSLEVEVYITNEESENDENISGEAISGDQAFTFAIDAILSTNTYNGKPGSGSVTYSEDEAAATYYADEDSKLLKDFNTVVGKNGERFYSICFKISN